MSKHPRFVRTIATVVFTLSMVSGARFCRAQENREHESPSTLATVSVSVTLVHIDGDALDELREETGLINLNALSPGKLRDLSRSHEGIHIESRSRLSVLSGHEASMGFQESEQHKHHGAEEEITGFTRREMLVHFEVKPEVDRQKNILVRFNYRRSEEEKNGFENDANNEENHLKRKFETSNTLLLPAGRARIVGSKEDEGAAMLLVMTADI